MSGTALVMINEGQKLPISWPVTVDERTMDKLHSVSELELTLLREISASNAQVRDTNAAILERLEQSDRDKEIRIRVLESSWTYVKGGVFSVATLGILAKVIQLYWAWGVPIK